MVRSVQKRKVQVWIVEGQHCLLLKTRPDRGSFWQPVTGTVDEDETPLQAAQREAIEETGIPFKNSPEPLGLAFEINNRGVRVFQEVFYYALDVRPWKIKLDKNEHVEGEWVPFAEVLPRLVHDANQKAFAGILKIFKKNTSEG